MDFLHAHTHFLFVIFNCMIIKELTSSLAFLSFRLICFALPTDKGLLLFHAGFGRVLVLPSCENQFQLVWFHLFILAQDPFFLSHRELVKYTADLFTPLRCALFFLAILCTRLLLLGHAVFNRTVEFAFSVSSCSQQKAQ